LKYLMCHKWQSQPYSTEPQ